MRHINRSLYQTKPGTPTVSELILQLREIQVIMSSQPYEAKIVQAKRKREVGKPNDVPTCWNATKTAYNRQQTCTSKYT